MQIQRKLTNQTSDYTKGDPVPKSVCVQIQYYIDWAPKILKTYALSVQSSSVTMLVTNPLTSTSSARVQKLKFHFFMTLDYTIDLLPPPPTTQV